MVIATQEKVSGWSVQSQDDGSSRCPITVALGIKNLELLLNVRKLGVNGMLRQIYLIHRMINVWHSLWRKETEALGRYSVRSIYLARLLISFLIGFRGFR